MSGYNEDWQRRKAYLIRSLFHDVPPYPVLSPITEESTQSSNTHNDHSTESSESQDPPNQYYSSYGESDGVTLSESTASLEAPAPHVKPTLEASSDRELPPLIIERMPNKHDEPPEFYIDLLIRMRRLYRKMFLERKDFDDHGQNLSRDDSVLNKESLSFNSNGYNADLESPDSYESNNNEPNVSDIPHNEEDNVINSIENDNNMISNDRNEIDNDSDANESSNLEMNEMEQESSDNEDPTYSQITFKADIHIDGRPHPAVRPSPIYERSQIEITSAPVNIVIAENEERLSENTSLELDLEETRVFRVPSRTRNSRVSSRSSSSSPTPVMYEDSHYEETSPSGYEEFEQNKEPHMDSMQTNEKPRLEVRKTLVSEAQFGLAQRALSPVFMSRSQYLRPMDSGKVLETALEDNQSLIGAQITTDAKIDTEASQCDDNKSKQDSAFVLRFRRSGERSLLVGRDSSMLENIQNPETSTSTEENDVHTKELEVMRTPRIERIDVSAESVPVGTNRLSSHIDDNINNCEHNMVVEDISNEAVESLDGGQIITGQQNVSGDIDDILATIFDNSQEIDEQSSSFREKSSRKRRSEEISVQTENVSWSDLRANFLVGTPKIFRLCSCVGHHCM